ncbi:3-demethylubiquinone-9 3-methyltransferase [Acetobacter sp.]|uniref:3-demethylubiquinone-9 3-methyltransferase n=1 Tax=Acetobacter sp. TaxID=440 RepID=UPI0039EBCD77
MTSQNTRRTIVALSALVVVGLGASGWIWVHRKANHELIEALEDARAHLPPGVEFTWSKAVALPATHGARLTDVVLKDPSGTISAAMIELIGATIVNDGRDDASPTAERSPLHFDHVLAHTLHISGATGTLDTKRLSLDGVTLPSPSEDQITKLTIDHGELTHGVLTPADGKAFLSADEAILDQYGIGRISRLTVRKLELEEADPPKQGLLIGKLVSDGADLASTAQAALKGQGPLLADGNLSLVVDDLESRGAFGGPNASVQKLASVEKAHIHINTADQKRNVTEGLTHLRVWPTAPQTAVIKALGYDRFDGDVVLNAIVDFGADVAHVTQLDIHAPKWGRLDLAGDFTHVTTPLGWLPVPFFSHLDISWRDGGLVSRMLNTAAVAQGMDPDAYVALLRRALAPQNASPDSVGRQLADYLAAPEAGTLTAMIAPPQPMPVSVLAELGALPAHPEIADKLGLTVQAPAKDRSEPAPQLPDPNQTTDEPDDPSILAPATPPSLATPKP